MSLGIGRQRRLSRRIDAMQTRIAGRRQAIAEQQTAIGQRLDQLLGSPLTLLLAAAGGVLLDQLRRPAAPAAVAPPPAAAFAHPMVDAATLIQALTGLLTSLQCPPATQQPPAASDDSPAS